MADPRPPKDRFHVFYFCIMILSIAANLPWRSLASGVDYFQYLYPYLKPEITIPLVFNFTPLVSISFTVATVHLFSVYKRLLLGSSLFLITLLSIPLMDIWIHNCTLDLNVAYGITLVMFFFISIAVGIQQSSIFGLSGVLLLPQYTQASATGASLAGIIASLSRIITKASFKEERIGAIAFFVLALLVVAIGVICIGILRFSKFVKYYMEKAKVSDIVNLKNIKQMNIDDDNSIEMKSLIEDDVVQQLQESIAAVKTNDAIVLVKPELETNKIKLHTQKLWKVIKKSWKAIISISIVYIVTVMIYPSLLSEIQYCPIGDWVPVVLVAVFSVMDIIGRSLTLLPYKLSPNWLLIASFLRFTFIPLIIICISPSPTNPVLSHASLWFALPVTIAVGFTHGYVGTTGFIVAPTLVEPHSKELTGTVTTFMMYLSASLGSGLAYAVNPLTTLDTKTPCIENYTATFNCLYGNYTEQ